MAAGLLYAGLALAMVAPALVPGRALAPSDWFWFMPPWAASKPTALVKPANPEPLDLPTFDYPMWRYVKRQLPHVPLWDPYIMSGRPLLANDQSAVFSPYSVPTYVLPFWRSLAWVAALKLWVAALGTFLLARALGMRFGAALLAGVVYGFNLWLVSSIMFPAASVWSFIPWLLLATEAVVRRPGVLSFAGLSGAVALQFLSGHAESSFHALLLAGCFFAFRALRSNLAPGTRARGLAHLALPFSAALALGTGLAALVLLPFGELLLNSSDAAQRSAGLVGEHISARFALGALLPGYFPQATGLTLTPLFTRALYAGALPLMLAAVALVGRRSADRIFFAAAGLLSLTIALGLAPFSLIARLPGFNIVHANRLVVVYMLCVALLAGWGLDDLCEGALPRLARRVVISLGGALLIVPLVLVLAGNRISHYAPRRAVEVASGLAGAPSATDPGGLDVVRLASVLVWVTMAGLALVLLALALRRRLSVELLVVLAVVLVAVDLFRAGSGYNPSIKESYASQPATGAIRFLQTQRPARFVSAATAFVFIPQNVIPLNFSLDEARGYDLPIINRYDRLWRQEVSPSAPTQKQGIDLALTRVTDRALRTLRFLSVSSILQPATDHLLSFAGLRIAYAGRDARVYHVDGALPRAFVVAGQQVVRDGAAALRAITNPGFAARRVAVTEQRVATLSNGMTAPGGTAAITTDDPEHVVIHATADRPSLVVLADNFYPGWQATVDGKAAPVQRVDYIFRGVAVSSGTHTIDYRYRPNSWTAGWIISLLSCVTLACMLLFHRARGRRRARHD